MRILTRFLAGAFCVLLLLGNNQCTNGSGSPSSGAPLFVTTLQITDANGNPATSFASSTSSSTVQINFTLTVRNRSNSAQTLFFSNSEQFNFAVIDDSNGNVVWNWDAANTPTTGSGSVTIPANGSQTFTAVSWNQANNAGNFVGAGTYDVIGGVTVFNTTGLNNSQDTSGDVMPTGIPTAGQLFPSIYRSTLTLFTIH
jgi:Intracellular proteinase inhibitor